MIKGTDIRLFSFQNGELISETISDVLIGEKTGSAPNELTDGRLLGYTLAIPKGDTHEWSDRFVGFFGYTFRTIGYPEQGIEENIPLRWHKKVRVELADISGVCTAIDAKSFTKHIYRYVTLRDARGGMIVSQDGSREAGQLLVQIYAPTLTDADYIPKTGDVIIPDVCELDVDTTSEQTVSQSLKAIKQAYPKYGAVTDVSLPYYGSRADIVLRAR